MDETNPNLLSCPDCGRSVSKLAQSCPGCGRVFRPITKDTPNLIGKLIAAAAIIFVVVSLLALGRDLINITLKYLR
jgi:predicted amidophosphoribosyltransferase